ncbi:hypothetical protein AAOE16_00015, partial [Ekhidna sp. MALMAid0563]|uniref:hypothetical protein n=1 Tax=Ekhidna sp. MALMAid0563 TaxID=3143937 RepID=UPI0032E01DF9
ITGNTRVDGNFQFDAAGNPVDNIVTTIGATGLDTNLPTEQAVREAISNTDELADLLDVNITDYGTGKILVADGVDSYDEQTVSGDIGLTNTGVTSITVGAIVDADVNASAAIDATKLADGSVTNAELQRINALTSAAVGVDDTQTLTNKTLTSPAV